MDRDLPVYTVYNNPKDFPGYYVVRRFVIRQGIEYPIADHDIFMKSKDLAEIHYKLIREMGLIRLSRSNDDDPVILESFV